MNKAGHAQYNLAGRTGVRALLWLGLLAAACIALACFTVSAAAEDSAVAPIRSVHKVKIENEEYCFHVQHNVVLTPGAITQIEKDEDLAAAILEASGFYMKAPNCTDESHPVITADQWVEKTHGSVFLRAEDIANIRKAEPVDGSPVKFYLDIGATREAKEPGGEEPKVYSTFQSTCPAILFVVVATDNDAKYEPSICEEAEVVTPETTETQTTPKKTAIPKIPKPKEDPLPENRTIKMTDRSGGPLEPVLKDGDPVTLEWIDASNKHDKADSGNVEDESSKQRVLAIAAIIAAAVLAAIVALIRKRSQND
ncbi:MAG: hypothetical protein E7219_07180 [Clostridiales bacterium]|jgi:hypothetical protein|nr:hypothetical protein [Clostridiales bacterium]